VERQRTRPLFSCCCSYAFSREADSSYGGSSEQQRFNSKVADAKSARAIGDQFSLVRDSFRRFAGGGARTHTILRSLDFESSASANSATPALGDRSERIRDSRASSTSPRWRVRCPQRTLFARKAQSRSGKRTLQQIEPSQTTRWPENFAKNNCVAQTGRRCKQRGDVCS
jgi:hypothetical protein